MTLVTTDLHGYRIVRRLDTKSTFFRDRRRRSEGKESRGATTLTISPFSLMAGAKTWVN